MGKGFFVCSVRQNRFFQLRELDTFGISLDPATIGRLNNDENVTVATSVTTNGCERCTTWHWPEVVAGLLTLYEPEKMVDRLADAFGAAET